MAFEAEKRLSPTNALPTEGARLLPPRRFVVPNSAVMYGANVCVGGLVPIQTGAPGGAMLAGGTYRVRALSADMTTPTTVMWCHFFDAAPPAGYFVDNQLGAMADLSTHWHSLQVGFSTFPAATLFQLSVTVPPIQTDPNGMIFAALITGAALTFTAANKLTGSIDLRW